MNFKKERISSILFYFSVFLVVYMPLHVFIVQSASLLTGGLEEWKAAKDVAVFVLSPLLLYLSFKRGLFKDKTFRLIFVLGVLYSLLHGAFLVFDQNDDTYSAIVGSVYNTRLLIYLLLGYLVGTAENRDKYIKYLLTAVVLVATVVSIFGVLQYFLPHDLLTNVGYSLERGVKPLFFIDDKPDLPRIMSTLKDPNSLGAYLILPIMLAGLAFFKKSANNELFIRPFRREVLAVMLITMLSALLLTFSRGALISLVLGGATILYIVTGQRVLMILKKFWYVPVLVVALCSMLFALTWNTYTLQNIVFHADESTVLEDPNELRVSLTQDAISDVLGTPLGSGPGSAGLVAISNPKGGILTENYYLQIAYEVGWVGLATFITITLVIARRLSSIIRTNSMSAAVLSTLIGYIFYSLLIHLWSNEALALQWWLLAGLALGVHIGVDSEEKSN